MCVCVFVCVFIFVFVCACGFVFVFVSMFVSAHGKVLRYAHVSLCGNKYISQGRKGALCQI